MNAGGRTVLILGAGINGCSVARELVLNGVGAWIVDTHDVACGATSRSSRLIHGGLRYLEYGDFHLVRESLAERTTLRRMAPHLVEPLRLYIPVAQRRGGLLQSGTRFLGVARSKVLGGLTSLLVRPTERGLWTIEIGLSLYDAFAADSATPRHSVHEVAEAGLPRVDPAAATAGSAVTATRKCVSPNAIASRCSTMRGRSLAKRTSSFAFSPILRLILRTDHSASRQPGAGRAALARRLSSSMRRERWGDLTFESAARAGPAVIRWDEGEPFHHASAGAQGGAR